MTFTKYNLLLIRPKKLSTRIDEIVNRMNWLSCCCIIWTQMRNTTVTLWPCKVTVTEIIGEVRLRYSCVYSNVRFYRSLSLPALARKCVNHPDMRWFPIDRLSLTVTGFCDCLRRFELSLLQFWSIALQRKFATVPRSVPTDASVARTFRATVKLRNNSVGDNASTSTVKRFIMEITLRFTWLHVTFRIRY